MTVREAEQFARRYDCHVLIDHNSGVIALVTSDGPDAMLIDGYLIRES